VTMKSVPFLFQSEPDIHWSQTLITEDAICWTIGRGILSKRLIPPVIGSPNEVLNADEMIERFGLDPARKKADMAGHFSQCSWILVECKSRSHIRKAVEQLEETVEQVDRDKYDVQNLAVVYDSLGPESRLYTVRKRNGKRRVLWIKTIGIGGPVQIAGIEVEAYTREQVKDMYTRLDVRSQG